MALTGFKFSDLNERLGTSFTGDELVCIEGLAGAPYTAATISAAAADNSINDSAGLLPVHPVGAYTTLSGFVDASGGLNGHHLVVSSDPNKLIIATDITADEAAGASVTVQERNASYFGKLSELANYFGSAGLANPLTGHTFKDSRNTEVTANVSTSTTRSAADGNVHVITLTANTTIDIALGAANASYLHLIIIPGAFTATLGTSFHKWLGSAPSTIEARHHIMAFSADGGTTNEARDMGGSA